MVMSWKKFVEKVQSEWAGWIFWQQWISELQQTVQENRQRAEQPRPVDVSDTTIDQLWNTDAQATDTGIIGKVKAKIAGKVMERAWVPIATNLVKEQLKQDKYKSIVWESSADEKAELGQKVANLQWVWQEYAQQQQEQRQKSLESLQKMALPSAKSIFKDYWQSVDWNITYLTNWKSILTQPTIQTIDWNSKLWQAYDTVWDVLQRENRLLSIEEFRSYFPEYDHIDDDTINFFMWWVANDVINRHQKTDIQTVANVMWSMSMVDWYTMKFDSALDLFTDDLFVKYWIPESAWNDPQQKEWIDAMDTLKTYADWLNQRWANMYGYSEYTVLQSYRNQVPEIDEALKILEKHSNKETNKWMEKYMSEYKTNITNMEVEIEAWTSWQNILNEVNKDINETIAWYIDNFVTNRAKSIADTTQEYGTQNLRLIRRILYWNYYKDDNWNYYDLTGELMAYTKDWETYTPDGKKINMNNYRIWLIRGWTNSLLWVSEWVTEFIADLKKWFVGWEKWVDEDLLRQYASEIVWDIIKTSFAAVMTASPTWLAYQTISQIPGWPWFAMEKYFQVLSWVFGTGWEMLANLTWFTDWWTEQGKEDFKETLTDLGWLLWWTVERDVQEWAKSKIRWTKRYKAFEKSMTAWIETLMDWLKLNRTISLWEALRKGNIDMKLAEELVGGKKTEGKVWEKTEWKVEGKTEKVEWKTEVKPTDKITEKPIEEIKTETKISKEEAPDTAKLTKTVIQEAFKTMVDTYKKEMWITENVKAKTDNLVNTIEQQGWNATEVKKAAEKIDDAINEISEVTAKESGIETPTTIEWVVKEMKDNFTNAVKNTEKTRTQRRIEARLDKQLKKSWFKDEEVTTLKENRYISVLNNVLENYIKEVYDTRKTIKKWKEVVEYIEREWRSKPEIQDMIFDEWYKQTAELMKNLKEWISEMDAATYRILPKTEAYNLVPLWRDWINWEWKIAEFIKRGDIEFYLDEDGWIKARYAGDMRTMDVMVESAINILNSILKEYNKATDNWKHLLSEYDILNIRDRIKPYAESKDMQTSMIGMDLMKNFNKFLDDNNMAPILRWADKVRAEYNTITELFDWILNENWEIKKQARNQMMKLDENQIQQLENLWLKWTRELLDLAKNWPWIVAHITNQLTKMVWRHPWAANVAYYWALWSTIWVLPGVLWKVVWIPLWRRFWKRVQEKFFDKVPEKDVNQMFIDSLKLTDEAKTKIEADRKAVEEATNKLLQRYKEMAEKWLEASKASMAKENKWVPLTEATTITEPKTTVTDAEFVASLWELSTAIDVATERYAKTLEEETINYANNLIKELWEEWAKAKIEEELNKFKSELEKQFWEKIEFLELTDEDVEIQKALDEQIANELGQEWEKPQVVSSEEWKSEAWEVKTEESSAENEKWIDSEWGGRIDIKSTQKPTKAAEKKRDMIKDAMEHPENYKDKKEYREIARIFEFYNWLPENLKDLLMDSWANTDYIKWNTNVYSNISKFKKALQEWLYDNWFIFAAYKYDKLGLWKDIKMYSWNPLTKKREFVTKKEADKVAKAMNDWSNALNINIPEALWEAEKWNIMPVFGKDLPEYWTRGKQNPTTRDVSFYDSQTIAMHEVAHEITQSLSLAIDATMENKKYWSQYIKDFKNEDMLWRDDFKNNSKRKKYFTKPTEIMSRWVEMYFAEKMWIDLDAFKDRWGYRDKETFESEIKPMVEDWLSDVRKKYWESPDITVDKMIDKLAEKWYFDDIPEIDEMWNIIEEQWMSLSDALMQDPTWPLDKIKEAYYKLNEAINNNETEWFSMDDIKASRDILQRAWVAKTKQND